MTACPLGRTLANRIKGDTDKGGQIKVNPDLTVPNYPTSTWPEIWRPKMLATAAGHLCAVGVIRAGYAVPGTVVRCYRFEVGRFDQDGDGVISAVEGDIDSASDGFEDNSRLFLPATSFNRFAVTREINDGLLAPRFAPSQKAWLVKGFAKRVDSAVPASAGRDSDDR